MANNGSEDIMLKTRSLFPHFGKAEVDGGYFGEFLLRMYDASKSSETLVRDWHGLGSTYDYYHFNPTFTTGEERFESTENYFRNNACTHFKCMRINLPYTYGKYVNWGYGWRIAINPFCRWVWSQSGPPVKEAIQALHWENYGKVGHGLRAEAYWTMRPKFEGEIGMLNFLYELKDFRDIAKYLSLDKNPLVRLMSLDTSSFRNLFKHLKRDKLSTPTKFAAEAHLMNSFAIQPLISDLKSIFQQLHEMVDEAERQFAAGGAGTKRHFSAKLGSDAAPTLISDADGIRYYGGVKYESLFTATASMKYRYRLKSGFDKQVAFWGLGFTAEALWNALPLSFLVDYFWSIGKALHVMRQDSDVTSFHINEYQESVLTKYQTGRFISPGTTPDNEYGMGVLIDQDYHAYTARVPILIDGWNVSHYTRELNQPYMGPALPLFKWPKTSQFVNMAALARCFI